MSAIVYRNIYLEYDSQYLQKHLDIILYWVETW